MTWRVARSLDQLLTQINRAAPDRSKASDGSIGDAAHASRESDHNPWVGPASDGKMIVTARDYTHDPAHGFDAYAFAETLRLHQDPRLKYVISNGRMFRSYSKVIGGKTYPAWSWAPYDGDNPHNKHTHVSVQPDESRYDSTKAWDLNRLATPPTGDTPHPEGDWFDMATPEQIEQAVHDGALRALQDYGKALFKDESGTGDTILDEARAHRTAELKALGDIASAVKAQAGS